ncbi:beta strand repeat-containing protein [Chitinophagaceae bacterium LWZ2-11]
MRKILLCLGCSILFSHVFAQKPDGYLDFGNPTDGVTATTSNTGFGGVRIGSGGGGFTLKNPGQEIGSGGELQGTAPTGSSVNSVGVISGINSGLFTISFEVYFSGGTSGSWYFFAGNGSSFSAAQSSTFTGADVFTGLQWQFGTSNTISTSNRNGGNWNTTGITGTPFAQNTAYTVTIVGNNTATASAYGNGQNVAANTYDLWINGTLVGDNLAKALLSSGTNINAFRFYGISSTGNVATIALDNIKWWNSCVAPSVSSYSTTSSIPANTYTDMNIYSAASLAGSTSVNNALTLAGVLTTNNNLTLKSNAGNTAYVGPVQGSGSISGNVTVERYIPAHSSRAYSLVSSPVNNPTIYNSWQEAGAATTGYGTQISGSATGNGFDFASASGTASIFNYNDNNAAGSKWVSLANTNSTTLSTGTGYLLFVRGDRTVGAGTGPLTATTLRASGTLITGSVNFAVTGGTAGTQALTSGAGSFSLIANPYAAPISWTTTSKNNLSGSFTVYDPNLMSFVTSNGTTVSPSTGKQQANVLQSGQAFFIQNNTSGNAPSLSISESDKLTTAATGSSSTVFGAATPSAQLNVNCYKADNSFADGAVAIFGSDYKKQEDGKDADKFTNFNEIVAFAENNKRFLSIDARPMPSGSDTLFIDLKQMTAGAIYNVVIDATGFNSDNVQNATLVDKVTGTRTLLNLTDQNKYSFTTTGATEAGRLYIVLSSNLSTGVIGETDTNNNNNSSVDKLSVKLMGNPVKNQITLQYAAKQAGAAFIRVIGSNGQPLNNINLGVQQQGTVNIPVAGYGAGLYFVEVTVGSEKVIVKAVKQ